MARTFVRQTQISSSADYDQNLNQSQRLAYVTDGGSLKSDLNVLRSVIKTNFGATNYWTSTSKSLTNVIDELGFALTSSANLLGNLRVEQNAYINNNLTASYVTASYVLINNTLNIDSFDAGVVKSDVNGLLSTSSIVDADVAANAAIAGTKINPDFGSQNITGSNGRLTGDLTVVNDINSRDLNARTGSFSGDLTVTGNLTVNGTTTTINSTTLTVDDKNIVLASGATTDNDADGGGIIVEGGSSNKNFTWYNSNALQADGSNLPSPIGYFAVNQHFLPANNNESFLGANDKQWKDIYGIDLHVSDIASIEKLEQTSSNGYIHAVGEITSSLRVSAPRLTGSILVKAGDIVISDGLIQSLTHVTMSSGGDLRFDDSHMANGILLADASNAALAGTIASEISIIGALNSLESTVAGLGGGVGHSKEILSFPGVNTSTRAVSSSFDFSTYDIQDDLNVYVNGVLVHASGSTTDENSISGVDAALKTGTTGTIVFAFDLTSGDVITLEKF